MRKVLMAVGMALVIFAGNPADAFAQEQSPAGSSKAEETKGAALSAEPTIKVWSKDHSLMEVPLFSPLSTRIPLATVNDEPITVGDLNSALTSSHGEREGQKKQAAKMDYSTILRRMVTVRLVVQEGRNMGFDELPEFKSTMDEFSTTTLDGLLIEELQKDAKADEKEVEKLYRDAVKEWKIKSVMFRKEDDAKRMDEEIKGGKSFDETAARALEEKLAEGSKEGRYVKPKDLQPELESAISSMKAGAVSPIIKIPIGKDEWGYVILALEEIRFPDNAEAREKAMDAALYASKVEAVKAFKRDWEKKYAKVDYDLLKKLDFESQSPGMEKLLKDKRAIVKIKGEQPLTVSDMAKALKERFYHGFEQAVKSKKVNKDKILVFDDLFQKRMFADEEKRRGLEKSERYQDAVRNYKDSLIFQAFVSKVIAPEIKVSEEEMKAYYDEHKKEYTFPEMIKLDMLVFAQLKDAESALTKLKQGADFKWMKANTEGQVPRDAKGVMPLDTTAMITNELPKGLQEVLTGSRAQDFRLYESPEGHYYVLYVQDVIPEKVEPFESLTSGIQSKVFFGKLNKSLEDWSNKLRESADIKIYYAGQEEKKETGKTD